MRVPRILVMMLLSCLSPLPAAAHHIRGIPHYSYAESYPTAPTFEEVREVNHFTMRMTFYAIPGTKSVDLALYVKDNRTGDPYQGTVIYSVYAEHEDPATAHSVTAFRNRNSIYKAGWTYEKDGLYFVRVRLGEAGELADESFAMQIGEPPVNYWFLGGSAAGVLLLIAVVVIIKRRRLPAAAPATIPASDIPDS